MSGLAVWKTHQLNEADLEGRDVRILEKTATLNVSQHSAEPVYPTIGESNRSISIDRTAR
jgi:hypothetical protein